jgi:hypothetical protein
MDPNQWNLVIYSLLSGVLGALLLFLFESRNSYQKANMATDNLITVLACDLKVLLGVFESGREIDSNRVSTMVWRELTPLVVELLPPELVKEIAGAYREVELNISINPKLPKDLKTVECLKRTLKMIESFQNSRPDFFTIAGFHARHKKTTVSGKRSRM